MSSTNWAKNVILVDADFLDNICFSFIVNFERMINRKIPQADLADWLECAMLDGGMREKENTVQSVFLHDEKKAKFENFNPSDFETDLNGKAFNGNLGEFRISSFPAVNRLVCMKDFFLQTLENIMQDKGVERVVVVGDFDSYGRDVTRLLATNAEKTVTLLTTNALNGHGFSQELLGYSLTHALGVRSEEFK